MSTEIRLLKSPATSMRLRFYLSKYTNISNRGSIYLFVHVEAQLYYHRFDYVIVQTLFLINILWYLEQVKTTQVKKYSVELWIQLWIYINHNTNQLHLCTNFKRKLIFFRCYDLQKSIVFQWCHKKYAKIFIHNLLFLYA